MRKYKKNMGRAIIFFLVLKLRPFFCQKTHFRDTGHSLWHSFSDPMLFERVQKIRGSEKMDFRSFSGAKSFSRWFYRVLLFFLSIFDKKSQNRDFSIFSHSDSKTSIWKSSTFDQKPWKNRISALKIVRVRESTQNLY